MEASVYMSVISVFDEFNYSNIKYLFMSSDVKSN